jgi:hypothetical protein
MPMRRDQVEGQLNVAVAQPDGHADGDGDGAMAHTTTQADGEPGEHGGGRPACGLTRDLMTGRARSRWIAR